MILAFFLADTLYYLLKISLDRLPQFPTNIISAYLYLAITISGYKRIVSMGESDGYASKVLAFIYAACILGFLNFVFELQWLTLFMVRAEYLNYGWLPIEDRWFSDGFYFLNYSRNFVFLLGFWFISKDGLRFVRLSVNSVSYGICLMLWMFFLFSLPSYGCIDYKYAIQMGWDRYTTLLYFGLTSLGKLPLYLSYRSLFLEVNRG